MLRAMLFAPGDNPRRVARALALDVDAVILDLEDAVALDRKAEARASVVAALAGPRTCPVYVRVNDLRGPFCHDDLMTVAGASPDGIVLPKVERGSDVLIADWALAQAERAAGHQPGALDLLPLVETAAGVLHAAEIAAAAPRVRRLAFGAADFLLDTGMTWTEDADALLWARSQLVLASRAAALEAPIDTVYLNLRDTAGYERDTARSRALGFQGRLVIHPDQIETARRLYAPSPAEIAWSRAAVEAFRQAEAAGVASVQVEGRFVDYPIARRAARTLAVAERLGLSAG